MNATPLLIARRLLPVAVLLVAAAAADRLATRPPRVEFARRTGELASVRDALLRYENEHGKLPRQIQELVPEYLRQSEIGVAAPLYRYAPDARLVAMAEGLVLHADLWGTGTGPHKRNGSYSELAVGGVGLGVTYYLMPWNLFFTGSVGPATSVFVQHLDTEDGSKDRTKTEIGTGIGVKAQIGKEWWVSDNWALGVAIQGDFSHTRGGDSRFTQGGGTVLFTATFN